MADKIIRFGSTILKDTGSALEVDTPIVFDDAVTSNSPSNSFIGDIETGTITTGALTVNGDAGVTGNINVGDRLGQSAGVAVASANSVTLGFDGNFFNITGTTEVRNINVGGWEQGSVIHLLFTGACPINTSFGGTGQIIDPGGDFTATANAVYSFVLYGTDWYRLK